ncbi:MAG: hypothetical protein U9R56_07960, partial [candidate division Zixibacteria bacterium]|nr:hypothetical protein [candidate division Zixibacteria bacterium]
MPSDTMSIDSLVVMMPRYVLSIERMTVTTMKVCDTLDVYLESFGKPIAGFDLKLATASHLISILDVLPGEIYDSCSWEFFNARQVNTSRWENYPPFLWQAVALAETVPDGKQPVCLGFDRKTSLIRLVVSSEHIPLVSDTTVAVFFFWEDCSDNTLSNATGDTLAMSVQVFDYFEADDYERKSIFPTRRGTPRQCIDPATVNKPLRLIEFHNGGVEFRMDINPDSTIK